jgi:hypothetical protein
MDCFLLRDAFAAGNLSPPVGRIKLPCSLVYERAGATGKPLAARRLFGAGEKIRRID